MEDKRLYSAAAERNQQPILDVLREWIRQGDRVVEVASGTGQHAAYFAARLPVSEYNPTDCNRESLDSILSYCHFDPIKSLCAAQYFDVLDSEWLWGPVDVIINLNMVHISPWEATLALLDRAGQWLKPQGMLFMYGPYFEHDVVPAPSNIAFDRSLKERNPEWGIRQLASVKKQALERGLELVSRVPMPANNLSLIYRKHSDEC